MSWLSDPGKALRRLARAQGFAATVVLTLAVAIAPLLVVMAFVDALAFRPLPFAEPTSLLRLHHQRLYDGDLGHLSLPTFLDLDRAMRPERFPDAKVELAAFRGITVTLADQSEALTRADAALVSADFFEVLGVKPSVGRSFVPGEDLPDAPRAAVLGHRLWQERFGSSPEILDRQILIDAQPHNVVGILPPGYELPFAADLWIPLGDRVRGSSRFNRYLNVIARLTGDRIAVERRLDEVAEELCERHPEEAFRFQLAPLKHSLLNDGVRSLWVLGAIALLLLAAAAANVGNLALARLASRATELEVRIACGALPQRLRWQVAAEMIWLTALGGVLGAAFAILGARTFLGSLPIELPTYLLPRVDVRTAACGAAVVALLGLGFWLLPVEVGLGTAGGRAKGRRGASAVWRRRLTQVQTALAFVLLCATTLLVHDAWRMRERELGFDPEVLTLRISLPPARYASVEQAVLYARELRERLAERLDSDRVALAAWAPVDTSTSGTNVLLEERGEWLADSRNSHYTVVTPGYFDTLGVPLLAGRAINSEDRTGGESAVVVNRSWLDAHAPDHDEHSILGTRVLVGSARNGWGWVVGVAKDIRHGGLAAPMEPHLYLAQAQSPWWSLAILAKSDTLSPEEVEQAVRRTVDGLDPAVPVFDVATAGKRVQDRLVVERTALGTVAGLGLLMLALATVGLVAVVAFLIHRERRTIGLRLVVGATPQTIRRHYVRRAVVDLLGASVAGALLTLLLWPSFGGLLHGPSPPRVTVLCLSFALLLLAVSAAAWVTSRRATLVDPAEVLRPR